LPTPYGAHRSSSLHSRVRPPQAREVALKLGKAFVIILMEVIEQGHL
jgi:hypothetical protein